VIDLCGRVLLLAALVSDPTAVIGARRQGL